MNPPEITVRIACNVDLSVLSCYYICVSITFCTEIVKQFVSASLTSLLTNNADNESNVQ